MTAKRSTWNKSPVGSLIPRPRLTRSFGKIFIVLPFTPAGSKGVGPRYCPSIEDKVVKFSEKAAHQLFLEPEGRHTDEYYVNGISTSLAL